MTSQNTIKSNASHGDNIQGATLICPIRKTVPIQSQPEGERKRARLVNKHTAATYSHSLSEGRQ